MKRVLSAALLVAAVFVITRYLPPGVFLGMIVLLTVLCVWEFGCLVVRRGHRVYLVATAAAAVWLVSGPIAPDGMLAAPLTAIILMLCAVAISRREPPDERVVDLALSVFAALFFGLLLRHVMALRGLAGQDGHDLPFLLLFVVAAADTGAFYVGRRVGRHPLAPALSPKKTVEGLAAGTVCAVLAALTARVWFIHRLRLVDCVAIGILLALVGALGDLVESLIKRWAGAKDSSSLIPGHGGVLDRVDALLFAAPVLFYYHQVFMGRAGG
ncbi:MAG: phosphatidate cytidylyltransferase [Acidobacteriota bacterium]